MITLREKSIGIPELAARAIAIKPEHRIMIFFESLQTRCPGQILETPSLSSLFRFAFDFVGQRGSIVDLAERFANRSGIDGDSARLFVFEDVV